MKDETRVCAPALELKESRDKDGKKDGEI